MDSLLNLDLFPLHKPGSDAWQRLVARCRRDLSNSGMFNLPDFLRAEAANRTVRSLVPKFERDSFEHKRQHNIYFKKSISELPPDHPVLQEFETSNRTLCADQLIGSDMLQLYEWPPFAQFLAACMGKAELFTMADPLAKVNIMAYQAGEALNWHFDRSEFTTTLLLQAPDAGGQFEFKPDLRSEDDPNYDGVAALLTGQDQPQTVALSAGTLNVFAGKNTAHRVTPVKGDVARMIAVFSFFERPGVSFSAEDRIGFYGRAR